MTVETRKKLCQTLIEYTFLKIRGSNIKLQICFDDQYWKVAVTFII